jgi:PKHD-type hydroxylase
MFLLVKDVLTPAELAEIRRLAAPLRFIDGKISNPHNQAKNNLQVDTTQPDALKASNIAGAAISRNEQIMNFVFPKRIASPLLARYEPGMKYGVHTDAAFLPLPTAPLRSDVSGTLYIADPESYEGGELIIHLGTEEVRVKGEAGAMVLYPSTTLHEVTPVTKGARLVMITFIESVIPDQIQRELLYTLNEVHALEGFNVSWENRTRLQFIAASLHRMWAR